MSDDLIARTDGDAGAQKESGITTVKGSNKWQRDVQRAIHFVCGVLLVLYVYSPAGDAPVFILFMRVVVMPVLVLNGLLMWQLPRLRKLMQGR